jgi:hypothetical protein
MTAGPDWKPHACTDCGAPWPSWSLTGPTGPWRCHDCHTAAAPIVAPIPTPPAIPAPAEGRLL